MTERRKLRGITMDGNMDVASQVRLMRTVIGRKYMEIDEYIDKSANAGPEDCIVYEGMIDFLKNDIKGYKAIIDDLKDGSNDLTGDYYDIASLPETAVGLYNDFYLPNLGEDDLRDEQMAMSLKIKYATELVENKYMKVGKAALDSPLCLALMSQNADILTLLGKVVLSEPELINALNEDN